MVEIIKNRPNEKQNWRERERERERESRGQLGRTRGEGWKRNNKKFM